VLRAALAASLPVTLFFTAWIIVFFGGFAALVLAGAKLPVWAPFALAAGAGLFGIPLLVCLTQRATYARTEYRFFAHELEYDQGRFEIDARSVPLASVTRIELRRGTAQRRAGTGTIVLETSVATGHGSLVRLADVDEPERALAQVTEIVERCAGSGVRTDTARTRRKRAGAAA
jgi:membrane protein YdbS with pleckstrin-like domain